MAQTEKTYYEDESLWGKYAYMSLVEMVNRILIETTDQDSYLTNIRRSKIVAVARDGIQELTKSVDKCLKAIEITVPPEQYFALPQDYVDWKRLSIIDDNFRMNTLYENNNIPMARGFLQDDNYLLLFDGNDSVLEADASNMFNKPHVKENLKPTDYLIPAEFRIWPERGIIAFSEEMVDKEYIIEYISDGLGEANLNDSEVYFHKMIYEPLKDYIYSECLWTRKGVPQSTKYAFRNKYLKTAHDAAVTALDLDTNKLLNPGPSQTLRISKET